MNPVVILIIGITLVIGMIIVLRVNAFVALITAAIVVSLLAPGDLAEKITRVAGAFGSVVGAIGIVIALAAVIGKCLMDSGAADRIVRSFLKLLGEKRAPTALMLSGFVLSIPVFFDTVFYLLVPLARSLWRTTRKNYVLYATAIVTGGAITHTLVPPTPGPLFMANRFGIDLGLMIVMGVIVGLPTAALGLLICKLINRFMDIPMRSYAGEQEIESPDDSQLPSLFVSLLPVILPIILISANTVTKTLADAEHAARLGAGDVQNWSAFNVSLAGKPAEEPSAAARLMSLLSGDVQQSIREGATTGSFSPESQSRALTALNNLLADSGLYETDAFAGIILPAEAEKMLAKGLGRASPAQVEHFNRLMLEEVFGEQIKPHVWNTPKRKVSAVAAVLGNPNLALLFSATIAMFVLVRTRGLSLKELSGKMDTALMSGGIIILITAGGGAFGAMLRAAGIKSCLENLLGGQGQTVGIVLLLSAFAVAAVMKFAQGSGTVSMITTSSMFAAMGITSEMLGCNIVYLAMVIGSGSLVGDWMNNSGFWIFARMSVLTETETLKSWTILTGTLGVIGMGFTLILAHLWPMMPPV
ncbi:MAG: gluconate permease [Planctomycetes bacterium]|nr:gluconate permease [Planctomycetota bacterium]